MSQTVQNSSHLRNRWVKWLTKNKDSLRDVARRAGIQASTLSRAIHAGVATEPVRQALMGINIPDELIPLPACSRTLAGIVFEQRERLRQLQSA